MLEHIKEFATQNAVNLICTAVCALIFVFVGFKLTNLFTKILKNSRVFQRLEDSAESFLLSFIRVALKICIIYFAATVIGIDATALSAVFGSVGLAIGLALQGSLSNFAGGMMILFFRPFKVGDFIESGVNTGTVIEIGVFYTKMLTVDNKTRIIPNGALSNAVVINYTLQKTRRIDFEITTPGTADVSTVLNILTEVANKHPLTLKKPDPISALIRMAPALLTFTLQVWVESDNYNKVFYEINEEIKNALVKAGI
ncbi:MAG: mechanosensitive ion channel family protein [Clostridia bacterium]|nr:mechanosensitive ion channel family protein [Clostridia bacterium]